MTATVANPSAEQLMAGAGKTFYRAARLLPGSVRADVILLYAFCRRVDDLADEPGAVVEVRRQALGALADAFEWRDRSVLSLAGWTFAAEGGMARAAKLLVQAAGQDLDQQQPGTADDLLGYCFGVAGTVGLMMAQVLHAEAAGFEAAVALGMAMQLSNIARDIAEDLGNGRVYLPACWVTAEAVRGAIQAGVAQDSHWVLGSTGRVLALAETLYEAAFDGIWTLPWRIRWSILAAALCYREIGRQAGRSGKLSWTERVIVSTPRKVWLIASAGVRLFSPRFWFPRRRVRVLLLGTAALAVIRHTDVA